MKKKIDLEAVFNFIKILHSSEFEYKDELVFYIFLTFETGMRAAHLSNFRFINDSEIKVSQTLKKEFTSTGRIIKLSKETQHNLHSVLSKAQLQHSRSDFPSALKVNASAKRYFNGSHLSLEQIRKAYIFHYKQRLIERFYEREHRRWLISDPNLISSIRSQNKLKAFNKESK